MYQGCVQFCWVLQVAGQRKSSTIEDMTLDGYEAFSSGAHVDSTILPERASVKRGTLSK